MKKKKLLFLVNDLSFLISHRLMIAQSALAKGFEVIIGYGETRGADPSNLEKQGFKTHHIPMYRGGTNIYREFKTFLYILKFFKKEKPDIAHLVTIKPYLYGGIVSRLVGVPGVISAISGLGTIFISNDIKFRLIRLLLYPFYKLAFNHPNQKIIIQNNDDIKVLVDWGVLNIFKVKLLRGSGVKIENFTNLQEPKGVTTVCFAARLLRDKGIYEFVFAAKLIKERGINARFFLAGDLDINNPTGLTIDDLKKLEEDSNIEFLGYQKDIASLYAKSHIICLPSYREGLPKSLIEAAAASRAIVTTDVPGCREVIIPNKTGLLVPVKNSQKLADALQWLIENPQHRIIMGLRGRKLAEKEYRIEKIVQSHLNIYNEVLSKT